MSDTKTKTETAEEKAAREQQERDIAGAVPAVDNTRSEEAQYDADKGTRPDVSDPEYIKVHLAAIEEYRQSVAVGNPLPIEYLAAKLGRTFD